MVFLITVLCFLRLRHHFLSGFFQIIPCVQTLYSPNRTWLIVKGANSTHVYQNCVHLDNHEHVERKNDWQSYCLPPDSEPEAGTGLNQNRGASQTQKETRSVRGRLLIARVWAFSGSTENMFVFIMPIVDFIIV